MSREPTFTSTDIDKIALVTCYGSLKVPLKVGAKILGRSDDCFAAYLHERGVTVEKNGKRKLVHIDDLVRLAADKSENVAAIRND